MRSRGERQKAFSENRRRKLNTNQFVMNRIVNVGNRSEGQSEDPESLPEAGAAVAQGASTRDTNPTVQPIHSASLTQRQLNPEMHRVPDNRLDHRPQPFLRVSAPGPNQHFKQKVPDVAPTRDYVDHARDPIRNLKRFLVRPVKPPEETFTFPRHLYKMLQNSSVNGTEHIVSWRPHGRAFIVRDRLAFEKIMDAYFTSTRFASFKRQLSLYLFSRVKDGPDKEAFFHELFLRGRPDLLDSVVRPPRIKGSHTIPVLVEAPQFHLLPPCQDLSKDSLEALCEGTALIQVRSISENELFRPVKLAHKNHNVAAQEDQEDNPESKLDAFNPLRVFEFDGSVRSVMGYCADGMQRYTLPDSSCSERSPFTHRHTKNPYR